ncbi:signal peptide peptidase A. Serine peptidase. MEROPS family S49 [Limimonas halophila]|uniref:Signal peptide peptidase A. Serine peptidase. MEROPS family S49 n=1 Tax=Limimonas halophila TaxID=1082479 RepID=A0A1G7TCS3_9PROT|nr:signal peptide peptidase SppA [Limimonas halophila]SDG32892.1 signal peptide peptidase A. Serine peptidase. MEROPS family S49 [Limimonas halophila]
MRLILFLLKCAVGFLASVGLIVILLAVAAGVAWEELKDFGPAEPEVPQRAVVSIDLTRGVAETPAANPLRRAAGDTPLVLRRAVDTIHTAADDPQVKALAVRVGRGGLGMAQAQEVHAAVEAFRESGKPAHAFAETLSGGAAGTIHAYLTSAFDRVWLQPSGDYDLIGFQAQSAFLKGALEKLGVTPRVDQRKAYKGLADRFTAEDMPEPQRENLGRLVDGLMDQVVRALAEGRGLDTGQVRTLAKNAPLSAEAAKDAGLVDTLGYRAEMEAALMEKAGEAAEPIAFDVYAAARDDRAPEDAPRVAVVDALGPVTAGESDGSPLMGPQTMGADTVSTGVQNALKDDAVRAIVLRVSSPGGSYVASDTIWHAVKQAREADTPIVVSMGDIAASGGYFVAAPANRIVAAPGTLTGSIGVAGGKFVLTGLWDKLGVSFDGVQTGPRADYWSPNSDFSEAEWKHFQQSLDDTYADFTSKVAQGRGLSEEAVAEAAQGKVFTGADAKAMGLVDSLGGFRHAVGVAKQLGEIPGDRRVRLEPFPKPEDPFRRFLQQALSGRIASPAARNLARVAETLRPVVDVVDMLDSRGRLRATPAAEAVGDPGSAARSGRFTPPQGS